VRLHLPVVGRRVIFHRAVAVRAAEVEDVMGVLLEQREVDGVRLVDRLHRVAESLSFGIGDPLGHDRGVTTALERSTLAFR
jgi:hypothetical protein